MLASFSEPIDAGKTERKGELEGVKERGRKRERKKQRKEREKEEGRKNTAKKQKTTFLQSFFNRICKTRTSIILNDFQNENITNLAWKVHLESSFFLLVRAE